MISHCVYYIAKISVAFFFKSDQVYNTFLQTKLKIPKGLYITLLHIGHPSMSVLYKDDSVKITLSFLKHKYYILDDSELLLIFDMSWNRQYRLPYICMTVLRFGCISHTYEKYMIKKRTEMNFLLWLAVWVYSPSWQERIMVTVFLAVVIGVWRSSSCCNYGSILKWRWKMVFS